MTKDEINIEQYFKYKESASYTTIKEYIPLKELDYDPNADRDDKVSLYGYNQFKTLYNPNDPKTEKFKCRLFPLFVTGKNGDDVDSIQIGKWYRCGQGELKGAVDESGSPIVDENGDIKNPKVKSTLGNLSYRPGWHLGSAPVSRHIGVGASRTAPNDFDAMYSQNVWALVEFSGHEVNESVPKNGFRDFASDEKFKDTFYIDLARKIPPFRVDYELPINNMSLLNSTN